MANTASAVQVEQYLENVDYPCDKQELIATARDEGADREVLNTLESLPEGTYNSPTEVSEGLSSAKY